LFLQNSRYFNLDVVDAEDGSGRTVKAVKLRRLPFASGTPTLVKGNTRLDVMAQSKYGDGTKFWHIGDANTELQPNDLLKERPQNKQEQSILVPEK
jgi:hypothetical protein